MKTFSIKISEQTICLVLVIFSFTLANDCFQRGSSLCFGKFLFEVLPDSPAERLSINMETKIKFSRCMKETVDECGGLHFLDLMNIFYKPQIDACTEDGCPEKEDNLGSFYPSTVHSSLLCLDDHRDEVLSCLTDTLITTAEIYPRAMANIKKMDSVDWCILYKRYLKCMVELAKEKCDESGHLLMLKYMKGYMKEVAELC